MCGIVGLLYRDPSRAVQDDELRRMCAAIVHRGPDDEGRHTDGNVGFAMRRLSIVDLAGGHQPMFNEDGRIAVVFNGEIFNYAELRLELESQGHSFRTKSDTETLVHGYEEWGDDLPSRLNGMFGFCVWDARARRMLLARDHLGVKPLYLYEDSEKLAWASEIKALLALPGIEARLDERALLDFLRFGYVPSPRTMFRRIRKIPPATVVAIESGRVASRTYWDLAFAEEHKSEAEWCEELRSLLEDAVRRQLVSDVPLGAFLSGGIDSSSIVATMRRLGVGRISTYAIGFGGQDAFHSELSKAASVARALETDHHEILVEPKVAELIPPLVRHLDEPVTDSSFLVTYLVSRLARESVTVILSGVGGDEIFAGYRRYLGPRLQRIYGKLPKSIHRAAIRPAMARVPVDRGSALKSMFRYARGFVDQADKPEPQRYQGYVSVFGDGQRGELLSQEFSELERDHTSDQVADYYACAPSADSLNRMLYADVKTSLVDSLLAFTDKMSMAVSLEARVPLLDYRLVELAARIPPPLKLKGFRGLKHIFKKAMSDRLAPEIITQKKQGFGAPVSRWLRGDLEPMLRDLLSPDRLRRRGYFCPAAVEKLIDDHFALRADHSEHIFALLTFEVWHETFLDGSGS